MLAAFAGDPTTLPAAGLPPAVAVAEAAEAVRAAALFGVGRICKEVTILSEKVPSSLARTFY